MLAFDIETLGFLETKPLPPITCVCFLHNDVEYKLRFWKVSEAEFETNKQTLLTQLDAATQLVGFNAIYFDLEYIRVFFGIDAERMRGWVLKCADPFMVCKHILKRTCGLNQLLALNNLGSKTGCGGNAIQLAMQERWDELLDYCMMDARLTYELCKLPRIAFSSFLKGYMSPDDGMRWHFEFCAQANHGLPDSGELVTVAPYDYGQMLQDGTMACG